MNRRDLLKFFGIGAVITPIVGGTPLVDVKASVLEIPKLDIVDPASMIPNLDTLPAPPNTARLIFDLKDAAGVSHTMNVPVVVDHISGGTTVHEIASLDDRGPQKRYIPGLWRLDFYCHAVEPGQFFPPLTQTITKK